MDSMLSQTFADFELIVLNDCSPDNAEEILDTYDDPRIVRYKGEKNAGLSNVLNVGIAYALSKFLNEPYSNIVAWMALGSTCSIYAEKLVE